MIRVEGLNVRYDGPQVLEDVSLQVRLGESVLLTGPSGCGKSTLARAICGLIPHSIPAHVDGEIKIAGVDVGKSSLATVAQRVGMVFQNPASQLFHLRVEDELAFGPRNLGWDEARIQASVDWALEVTGLVGLRERRPAELSGGQKQCVAIAAILAMRPDVLVLDEPTASLDVPSTQRVMQTIRALREQQNVTILIIEHRLAEILRIVDRVVIMKAGRIEANGAPDVVMNDRGIRELLGLRRPVNERMSSWKSLIRPDGNDAARTQEPLLSLQGVAAGYGRRTVVSDVDLNLFPGDFLGLVGANGVGKSTLALVAAGLIKPSKGRVVYQGARLPRPGLDISLLFQNPVDQLFTDSVDDEVAFAPQNYRQFNTARHEQVLEAADLSELRRRRPMTLSAGQQQRAALAACLSLAPKVLILDEPTLGQDWGHLQRLMEFLLRLNRQGTAILLISHDFKLLHHYVQCVLLLEDGRIKQAGRVRQLPAVRAQNVAKEQMEYGLGGYVSQLPPTEVGGLQLGSNDGAIDTKVL